MAPSLLALLAALGLVVQAAALPLMVGSQPWTAVLVRSALVWTCSAAALVLCGGATGVLLGTLVYLAAFGLLALGLARVLWVLGLGPVAAAWLLSLALSLSLTLPLWSGGWIEAAPDSASRARRIARVLGACPLAPLWGHLLGHDFLKSPPWYRRSVIGAYYPYVYPDWREAAWAMAIAGLALAALAELGRTIRRRPAGTAALILVLLFPVVAGADESPPSDNPRVQVEGPPPAWIRLGLGWRAWSGEGRWRREGLGLEGTAIDVDSDLSLKSLGHAPALRYALRDRRQTLTLDYQRTIVQADRHVAARDLVVRGLRFPAGDLVDASLVLRRTGLSYRRALLDLGPLRLELGAGGRHLGYKLRLRDLGAGFATRVPENVWLPQGELALRLFPDRPLELILRGAGFAGSDASREVRQLELQGGLALRLSDLVWLEADYLSETIFVERDGRGELDLSFAGPGLFAVFRF